MCAAVAVFGTSSDVSAETTRRFACPPKLQPCFLAGYSGLPDALLVSVGLRPLRH